MSVLYWPVFACEIVYVNQKQLHFRSNENKRVQVAIVGSVTVFESYSVLLLFYIYFFKI